LAVAREVAKEYELDGVFIAAPKELCSGEEEMNLLLVRFILKNRVVPSSLDPQSQRTAEKAAIKGQTKAVKIRWMSIRRMHTSKTCRLAT